MKLAHERPPIADGMHIIVDVYSRQVAEYEACKAQLKLCAEELRERANHYMSFIKGMNPQNYDTDCLFYKDMAKEMSKLAEEWDPKEKETSDGQKR